MPKGALLHAHLDATVDVNFLLNRILEQEALYVRASAPSTTLSPFANALPEFSPFPKSEVKLSASQSLTDTSYDGGWIPVKIARETFSSELGGPGGFDKWYIASITINPADRGFCDFNLPNTRGQKSCGTDSGELYQFRLY